MRIGSEVLTEVIMKSTIFWDITPCSPLSVNRSFATFFEALASDSVNEVAEGNAETDSEDNSSGLDE
jgi:hypothetical protein